jgi:hypothetical protein
VKGAGGSGVRRRLRGGECLEELSGSGVEGVDVVELPGAVEDE